MSRKLRVATVGTGYFSRFHYNAWHDMADVDLVGVCNRTLTGAEDFAARYDIPASFDDLDQLLAETSPDILDIITPPETHVDFVRKALKHDVTVICQKPFTPSLSEARLLVGDI